MLGVGRKIQLPFELWASFKIFVNKILLIIIYWPACSNLLYIYFTPNILIDFKLGLGIHANLVFVEFWCKLFRCNDPMYSKPVFNGVPDRILYTVIPYNVLTNQSVLNRQWSACSILIFNGEQTLVHNPSFSNQLGRHCFGALQSITSWACALNTGYCVQWFPGVRYYCCHCRQIGLILG